MQKLINVLALASFGVSACVVGAGIYLYQNKDAIIEAAVELATSELMPDVPEIPDVSETLGADAIPSPAGGSSTIPPLTLPM